jgi:hypothetical protein
VDRKTFSLPIAGDARYEIALSTSGLTFVLSAHRFPARLLSKWKNDTGRDIMLVWSKMEFGLKPSAQSNSHWKKDRNGCAPGAVAQFACMIACVQIVAKRWSRLTKKI